MKRFVIEMWDIDTRHPFLYTDDGGEVCTFETKADAQIIVDILMKNDGADYRFDYHITNTPSVHALPLSREEDF